MLFTILYCDECEQVDIKLWLLLNSLLDCFVQLREKICKYLILFRFSGSVENGKRLRQIYNHDV